MVLRNSSSGTGLGRKRELSVSVISLRIWSGDASPLMKRMGVAWVAELRRSDSKRCAPVLPGMW
jgi:hypothetical protein